VTADLVGRFNAVDLVRRGAEALAAKAAAAGPTWPGRRPDAPRRKPPSTPSRGDHGRA